MPKPKTAWVSGFCHPAHPTTPTAAATAHGTRGLSMADLCVLCRIGPAVITVGDHNLCLDCSDDYSLCLED